MPKEAIQKMIPYDAPKEGRMGALRLDFNENLLGASPKVMEALKNVSREACGCYPEYGDLNAALSQFLSVPEDCVIATNGSDEAIRVLFDAYVEKGDEVILLSPSYSMYELYAQVAGAKIVRVSYREDFTFPIDAVLRAIGPNTRLIALANPNNPSGTMIARQDLLKIIEANPKMAVLIDEAYALYAQETNIDLSLLYGNVFVSQTFSKAHGLAGLRIGYLVSKRENVETIAKILSPSYSVDCLAATAVLAAMKDQTYVETYVGEIIAVREQFSEEVRSLGFFVVPSKGNFVLIQFGEWTEKIQSALFQQKILVRERADLAGFLRITIGSKEQMQKVFALVQSVCSAPGLIFDMDGVLVDESRSYRPCIVKTAEDFLKRRIDPEFVENLKQRGGYNNDYDCTEAVLAEYGLQVCRKELIARFDAYYQDFKLSERWLLDEELLLKLKEKFRLGIFTGRPRRDAFDALKRFDKESLFEVVITDDDVKERKPSPEGLISALKQLKVSKAVYLGDSKDDEESAFRAGVEFIKIEAPGCGINAILERMLCQREL